MLNSRNNKKVNNDKIIMTTRPLHKRMDEHLRGNQPWSIKDHLKSTNHQAAIKNFKIRYTADPRLSEFKTQKVLEIVEAKLVNDEQPAFCAQKILERKLGFTGINLYKASKTFEK